MRTLFLILLCLLIVIHVSTAPYLTSLSTQGTGRHATKETSLEPIEKVQDEEEKIKVNGGIKSSRKVLTRGEKKGGGDEEEEEEEGDGDGLVYNVDYHGVSTHPTPTPKHPKP